MRTSENGAYDEHPNSVLAAVSSRKLDSALRNRFFRNRKIYHEQRRQDELHHALGDQSGEHYESIPSSFVSFEDEVERDEDA